MTVGGLGSGDVTRICRTIDYLRRSIDNQTAILKDQNDLMRQFLDQQSQVVLNETIFVDGSELRNEL